MFFIPVLVCLAGLLLYLFSHPVPQPKMMEIGRIMFYLGLAGFLLECVLGHTFEVPHLSMH